MKKDNRLDVGEGYRIPNISEFKQGFKFERAHDSRMIFLDLSKPSKKNKTPFERSWEKMEVWWMETDPDKWIHEKTEAGNIVYYRTMTANFFKPFDVESFLKQGLIRVKNESAST